MLLADVAVHHRLQLYTKVTTAENVSKENHEETDMKSLQLVYKDDQCIVLHDIWTVKTIRRQDKNTLNDTDVQATWVWKRSIRA